MKKEEHQSITISKIKRTQRQSPMRRSLPQQQMIKKQNSTEMKEEIIHLNRKTLLQILSKLQKPILITRISEDQSLDKPTNDISHNNAKSENQNSFDPEFDSGWRTYIVLARLYSSTTDYGADSRKNPSSTRAAKVKANGW